MPKDNNVYHLNVRNACKRLENAIDANPDFFKNLTIHQNNTVVNDNLKIRNYSVLGLILLFFVKAFH